MFSENRKLLFYFDFLRVKKDDIAMKLGKVFRLVLKNFQIWWKQIFENILHLLNQSGTTLVHFMYIKKQEKDTTAISYLGNRLEVFCKKGVLKILTKFRDSGADAFLWILRIF